MRLIDAADAFTVLTEYYHHRTEEMHNALREALDRVPTVDAVPKSDYMSMQATVKKLTDAIAEMDKCIEDEPQCERCIHSDRHMKGNKNVYCEILSKIVPANGECWQYSQKPNQKNL